MKIAYSFGVIDFLHYGHIHALLNAKQECDMHIFGLVGESTSMNWMGNVLSSFDERRSVLEQIKCIDQIIYQKTLDPTNNLKEIHMQYPDAEILIYHRNDCELVIMDELLNDINATIISIDYYEKMSPENVLKAMNNEIESKISISNLISTKAGTLLSLKSRLTRSFIEDIFVLNIGEYLLDEKFVLDTIKKQFDGKKIVVRSSCTDEDNLIKSNAGCYESILNVDSGSEYKVKEAITAVMNSYKKDVRSLHNEQILIQTQTTDISKSGVLFTRDIHENRPYYFINYDAEGSTDLVTSGQGGNTLWVSRDNDVKKLNGEWKNLILAVKEIEQILNGMILDIEFAIKFNGDIVIFQVRPLASNYKFNKYVDDDQFFKLKNEIKNDYVVMCNSVNNDLMILSDMAFWNPSEMIGSNPRNLDYSLYKEIITSTTWNGGLISMGYKKVQKDLMYRLGNKPYISVEYSFMSLIPAKINNNLSEKLIDFYCNKLKSNLTAHDKIEFEIVYSCYDFSIENRIKELLDANFTLEEVQEVSVQLFKLTNELIFNYNKVLEKDLKDLNILRGIAKEIKNEGLTQEYSVHYLISKFEKLIRSIKKYGTPQFARQARYAFIARALEKTLVEKGYFTNEEMDKFLRSIFTVASEFEHDFKKYSNKQMTESEFKEKYGHLRSGTYNIRVPNYEQMDFQTNELKNVYQDVQNKIYDLNKEILEQAIVDIGFDIDVNEFIGFLKGALEHREYFKFEFTKALSLALEMLVLIGEKIGLDKEKLSYLEFPEILAAKHYSTEYELRKFLITIIKQREREHEEYSRLVLSEVVMNEEDFDFIEIRESRPNFITDKSVSGEVVVLDGKDIDFSVEGKIVVISKADPGYDWLFTKNIKGLITKYGGAASHMAIRCSEFEVPAAIGCGENIYNFVLQQNCIQIDCKNEKINKKY
ncbi:MAG: hypothetical protein LBT69_03665 [Lactobacillales bacterium]|jgi:glycerol-3-phosphate cytidylyltransferase-like family protein/phosphohistidine swiveling domain-containing protein|nr:hypothetical protein [Lactobacillales bacterium]